MAATPARLPFYPRMDAQIGPETGRPRALGSRCARLPESSTGSRFEFGKNWRRFLSVLDDSRIAEAERSLEQRHLEALGDWEVVYAWGVLHHTGDMWRAMANVGRLVAPRGLLFISLYNDQGLRSRVWRTIKRTYNRLPPLMRPAFVVAVMGPREAVAPGGEVARLKPMAYLQGWSEYKRSRGMSRWHDLVDWVGGYPFEVARPDDVFRFYRDRGFTLVELVTRTAGCNEYVLVRDALP